MSHLTDSPDLMLEVLAIMVKRSGGRVTITASETLEPFNLLSKFDEDGIHLFLDEDITAEQVNLINGVEGQQ